MKLGTLFFVVIICAVCFTGLILSVASSPEPVSSDTFGNAPSVQTNHTATLVNTTVQLDTNTGGYLLIFLAIIVILVIGFGMVMAYRDGFSKKYRT